MITMSSKKIKAPEEQAGYMNACSLDKQVLFNSISREMYNTYEGYLENCLVTPPPLSPSVSLHRNTVLPLLRRQLFIERTHKAKSCPISLALSCCLTFSLFVNVPHL